MSRYSKKYDKPQPYLMICVVSQRYEVRQRSHTTYKPDNTRIGLPGEATITLGDRGFNLAAVKLNFRI